MDGREPTSNERERGGGKGEARISAPPPKKNLQTKLRT